jgi:hypothetical protein
MWFVLCVIHVYAWVTHKFRVGKTQMWFVWCKENLGCFYIMCCMWHDQSSPSLTTFVVNFKALKPILGRHLFSGTGLFLYIKHCEAWRASLIIFLANLSSLGHRHRYVLFLHNGMHNRYSNMWYPLDINLSICIGTYS